MAEVQTLNELTDRIDEKKYPKGVCPLMSTVQFVPIQDKMSIGQVVPVPMPGFAPCLGGKCQVWHKVKNECSFRSDTDLIDVLDAVRGILDHMELHLTKVADAALMVRQAADTYYQKNPI